MLEKNKRLIKAGKDRDALEKYEVFLKEDNIDILESIEAYEGMGKAADSLKDYKKALEAY